MNFQLRVLFIKWLLDDRNITRERLRIRLRYSKSKMDKIMSAKGYKHIDDKMLDKIEHTIHLMSKKKNSEGQYIYRYITSSDVKY